MTKQLLLTAIAGMPAEGELGAELFGGGVYTDLIVEPMRVTRRWNGGIRWISPRGRSIVWVIRRDYRPAVGGPAVGGPAVGGSD